MSMSCLPLLVVLPFVEARAALLASAARELSDVLGLFIVRWLPLYFSFSKVSARIIILP